MMKMSVSAPARSKALALSTSQLVPGIVGINTFGLVMASFHGKAEFRFHFINDRNISRKISRTPWENRIQRLLIRTKKVFQRNFRIRYFHHLSADGAENSRVRLLCVLFYQFRRSFHNDRPDRQFPIYFGRGKVPVVKSTPSLLPKAISAAVIGDTAGVLRLSWPQYLLSSLPDTGNRHAV